MRAMQLPPRKNIIIIIGSLLWLILISIWVWFFVFRTPESDVGTPIIPDAPVVAENDDDIRIRHLNLIKKSIQDALGRGLKLPLPENALEIRFWKDILVNQGKMPESFYDILGLNTLVDPKTGESYSYGLSPDGLRYQIVAYLDDVQRGNFPLAETVVYSIGDWAVFVQDKEWNIITLERAGAPLIDLALSEIRQKLGLETLRSCQDIYSSKSFATKPKSGVYDIDIDGRNTKVFCDMQTDGGGWTLFYANNGHPDSPIQKSYVEMRETMKSQPLADFSNFDDPNLAGLLDYSHFIEIGAKEILIRNRAWDGKKWVKFTFSTSKVLDWALWPAVLGRTEYWCINLPRRAMWNIVNNDKVIIYEGLTQMMNHGGASWGVSHEKYHCNGYETLTYPHIGFYSSADNSYEWRVRSSDWVGGKMWGENEYRYFVR